MSRNLVIFGLLLAINNLGLGLYFVLLAWTALSITDQVAVVGHIFLIGSLTNLCLAPFIGNFADRHSRRFVAMCGKVFAVVALFLPSLLEYFGNDLNQEHLYAIAVLHSLSITLLAGSLDGILQTLCPKDGIRRVAAAFSVIRQLSLVVGTGFTGLLIHEIGTLPTFLIGGVLAVLGLVLLPLLPDLRHASNRRVRLSYLQDLRAGFSYAIAHKQILLLGGAIATCFSVSQLTNALLPAFIQRDMGATSRLYGLVEASWAVGGIAASLLLIPLLARRTLSGFEFKALILLGLSTMSFAAIDSPLLLVILHGIMGASFSITRVLSDGQLLQTCSPDMVGRIRANISAVTSLVGVSIYLAPTFITVQKVYPWYLLSGATVILVGLGLHFAHSSSLKTAHYNETGRS